jgi:hypothetical protein
MSTWTTISNGAVAVGGIPASSTVTALRDNPIAIAEAASGSPVVYAGWHPPDKLSVGDGEAGLIYDGAVNGTQATIETPDFEDGFEYRLVGKDLVRSGSGGSMQVLGYFQTDAAYRLLVQSPSGPSENNNEYGFDIEILMPRVAATAHLVRASMHGLNSFSYPQQSSTSASDENPAQKLLRAQVKMSEGNITAGKIWLLRRREFISSP